MNQLSKFLAIGMLLVAVSWIFDLIPLNFVIAFLVFSNFILVLQSNKFENLDVSMNGRFSRTYNQYGDVVNTRWIEVIEDGYWVTIITDKEMNLYAEHTRTTENAEKHKDDRDQQETDYNKSVVWGEIFPKTRKIKQQRDRNQSLTARLRSKNKFN